MKVKIDIDTRVFVRLIAVLLAFLVVIGIIIKVQGALVILGISFFLALALNPPVTMLARKLPGNSRIGATAIAYLAVIVLLGGFLVLIVPPVIEQSAKFADTVPGLIDQVTEKRTVFDDFIHRYGLEQTVNNSINSAKQEASSVAANLGNSLVGGVGTILGGIANLVFVLVLAFLMLIEGPAWMARIWGLYEDEDLLERHRTLIHRMYRIVTGFVIGQVTVAGIAAASTLVVLLTLSATVGLPTNLAIPLAVIIFLFDMIPMIGATVGAVLVGLIILFNSPTAALIFIIYYVIYQQIENNFIGPTIQSKNVDISALMILSAILVGVTLGGILGGIVAIPIAGCLRVLLVDQLEHARKKREKDERNPVKRLVKKAKA
jgi:predicted PurR-regulated permease PerM